MIYWDTSVVLKLYVEEADSEPWQAKVMREAGPLVSSSLLVAEMAFALRHKAMTGQIATAGARAIYEIFRNDIQEGRIHVFPIGNDILDRCVSLADMGSRPRIPSLRTLEGLHLAAATVLKCRKIATVDKRLAAAAKSMGFAMVE